MPNTVQPVFLTGRGSSDHTSSCAKPAHAKPAHAELDAADSQHDQDTAMGSALAGARDGNQLRGTTKQEPHLPPRPGSQQQMRSWVRPASLRASCLPVRRCYSSGIGRPRIRRSRTSPTRLPGPPALILGPAGTAAKNRDVEVPGPAELSSPRITREMPKRSTAGSAPLSPGRPAADRARIAVLVTLLVLVGAALLAIGIARMPARPKRASP
jgi:hypothetical protein